MTSDSRPNDLVVPLPAELLNLAGEYAVASQLSRFGHYAQLTFGNRKRTDMLVDATDHTLFRAEVKAKQRREWPGVQAPREGDFLLLVDFQHKTREEPPDFYILNFQDWIALVEAHKQHRPHIQVDEKYCVRHPDGWQGLNLTVEWVRQHHRAWSKLPATKTDATSQNTNPLQRTARYVPPNPPGPGPTSMSFRAYLERHYVTACKVQRGISRDFEMIAMLKNGRPNHDLVKSWMKDYGLFQGITGPDRDAIVDCFLRFARSHKRKSQVPDEFIAKLYRELFTALFRQAPRSWMSATSKLLWCLYPESVAMYDKFVHRTLVVMQSIDTDLADLPRIGTPPIIKKEADILPATAFYMKYRAMVRRLESAHAETLAKLRRQNNEEYPYNIRIVDKLLWMIGNPDFEIERGGPTIRGSEEQAETPVA